MARKLELKQGDDDGLDSEPDRHRARLGVDHSDVEVDVLMLRSRAASEMSGSSLQHAVVGLDRRDLTGLS